MSEHTAGPWIIDPDNKATGCLRVLAADGGMVAECWVNTRWDNKIARTTGQQEANARLIAAAPALLAALEAILDVLKPDSLGYFQGDVNLLTCEHMIQACEAIKEVA